MRTRHPPLAGGCFAKLGCKLHQALAWVALIRAAAGQARITRSSSIQRSALTSAYPGLARLVSGSLHGAGGTDQATGTADQDRELGSNVSAASLAGSWPGLHLSAMVAKAKVHMFQDTGVPCPGQCMHVLHHVHALLLWDCGDCRAGLTLLLCMQT